MQVGDLSCKIIENGKLLKSQDKLEVLCLKGWLINELLINIAY